MAWPGNVRELQNVMEHLAVLAEAGSVIQADDLPVRGDGAATSSATRGWPAHLMSKAYHPAKEAVLAHFEKEYLATLVVRADRNMSKAARLAGIDRTTLYRLLEKHSISTDGHAGSPIGIDAPDRVALPTESARIAD
jgi:DNA-binding NtrC family response regulator